MATTFSTDSVTYPSFSSRVYVPDQLIYDTRLVVTEDAVIGATTTGLKRGTVLALVSGAYVVAVTTDTAGSKYGILVADVPIDAATQSASVYVAGEFNANALSFDQGFAGLTTGTVISGGADGAPAVTQYGVGIAALAAVLGAQGIHLKTAISAIGPNYATN